MIFGLASIAGGVVLGERSAKREGKNTLWAIAYICWMARYWPQLFLNTSRGRTIGLNMDYLIWSLASTMYALLVEILSESSFSNKKAADWFSTVTSKEQLVFVLHNFTLVAFLYGQCLWLDGAKLQWPSPFPLGTFVSSIAASAIFFVVFVAIWLRSNSTLSIISPWLDVVQKFAWASSILRFYPQIHGFYKYKIHIGLDLVGVALDGIGGAALALAVILNAPCSSYASSSSGCSNTVTTSVLANLPDVIVGGLTFVLSLTLLFQAAIYSSVPDFHSQKAAFAAAQQAVVTAAASSPSPATTVHASRSMYDEIDQNVTIRRREGDADDGEGDTFWLCTACGNENLIEDPVCRGCALDRGAVLTDTEFVDNYFRASLSSEEGRV